MRARLVIVAAAAVTLAACASSPAAPVTSPPSSSASSTHTDSPSASAGAVDLYAGAKPAVAPAGSVVERKLATPDGRTRTYRLFVPTGLTGTAPLLVALHGAGGSGAQFEATSGFDALATSNRFLVAYPDGIGMGASGDAIRTWDAGGCCGIAAKSMVDDVAFLRSVVADAQAQHSVDPARVFLAGHSNGAMMSLRLACEAPDLFAAAGVQSGALMSSPCAPSKPLSLLQIHGRADNVVPIDGGSGVLGATVFPPSRDAATTLARADGCAADPATVVDIDNPSVTVTTWSSCTSSTSVEYVAVAGAAHPWMSGPPSSVPSGTAYPAIDSSRAIWAFVSAHPRT